MITKFKLYENIISLVQDNNIEKLKKLIETGIDLNANLDKDGGTALHYSAALNKIEITKLLIDFRADLDIQDSDGNTALIYALPYYQIAKLLIDSGAKLNTQNNKHETALIDAMLNNKIKISKLLIESGADLNIQDNNGDTALIISAHYNNISMIKLLINNNADWNIENKKDEDFLDKLETNDIINPPKFPGEYKNKIKKLYPEKYKDYLIMKNVIISSRKYNL